MKIEKPYTAGTNNMSYPYVEGPGFDWYQHTLRPQLSLDSKAQADVATQIANTAYLEGYKASQRNIKQALGIA